MTEVNGSNVFEGVTQSFIGVDREAAVHGHGRSATLLAWWSTWPAEAALDLKFG